MGQLLDLGDQAGKAAPGEYGPRALLNARGSTIVRDSTGKPVELVLPAAGLFLGSDGTDLKGRYPPGYLTANDLGAAYSNSAAETTVLAGGDIANVFPAGVAVGDAVHIRAAGTWLNNSGGTQTLLLNVYMGSTIIAAFTSAAVSASATTRNWQLDVEVIYSIIGGAGAGAIRPIVGFMVPTALGTGVQNVNSGTTTLGFNGAASQTIATNAAATGNLKATTSNGTATTTVTCNIFRARYFPKNY